MLRDMTKVVKAGEWLTEHLSIQEYFEDLYVEHYRGGLVPGVTEEVCQTVIDHAGDVVKAGGVLGIFPEGTRSKTGELLKPKSGVILIAANTGGDILPVAITQMPKRKFRRKHIHLAFGEMIPNKELAVDGPRNLAQIKSASKLLMARIADLRQVSLQAHKD